jgi:hypothetical protein
MPFFRQRRPTALQKQLHGCQHTMGSLKQPTDIATPVIHCDVSIFRQAIPYSEIILKDLQLGFFVEEKVVFFSQED